MFMRFIEELYGILTLCSSAHLDGFLSRPLLLPSEVYIQSIMEISQKAVDEFKEIYRKKEGKELSDSEAYEAASNLLGFCKLIMDLSMEEARRERQLKKEPNGFLLPDKGYSCCICHGASGGG